MDFLSKIEAEAKQYIIPRQKHPQTLEKDLLCTSGSKRICSGVSEDQRKPFAGKTTDFSTLCKSSVEKNNELVKQALGLSWRGASVKDEWKQIFHKFHSFHMNLKSANMSLPLESRLDIAFNTLWCGCMSPRGVAESLVGECCAVITDVYEQVLKTCKVWNSSISLLEEENLLMLMEKTLHHILELPAVVGLQIVEIYYLTIQMFLVVQKISSHLAFKYLSFISSVFELKKQIVFSVEEKIKKDAEKNQDKNLRDKNITLHSQGPSAYDTNKAEMEVDVSETEDGVCVEMLKFGFCQKKCTLRNICPECPFQMLRFAAVQCSIRVNNLEHSICVLGEDPGCYKFLYFYLKAYIFHKLNQLEASLLYLNNISHLPLDINQQVKYHLFKADILSRKGEHLLAQQELFKPLKLYEDQKYMSDHRPEIMNQVALKYKEIYEKHPQHSLEESSDCMSKNTLYSILRAGHVDSLVELIKLLESDKAGAVRSTPTPESTILRVLHPQTNVTLPQVLYELGKRYAEDKKVILAAQTFSKLLAVWPISQHHNGSVDCAVLHTDMRLDAAAVFIQSGDVKQARALCDVERNKIVTRLTNLEARVVGLMLLSEVQRRCKEKFEEGFTLERCVEAFTSSSKHMQAENTEESKRCREGLSLLEAIMGKVWLRKALNHILRYNYEDARFCFKMVFMYNPGDEEALQRYISFLRSRGDTEADAVASHSLKINKIVLPINSCDIALRFLLGSLIR